MSRVYFHSPSGEAELLGAERAHAWRLAHDVAEERMGSSRPLLYESARKLTANSYVNRRHGPQFMDDFLVALSVGRDNLLTWRDREIRASSLMLNTALALGDDVMKLMARLYGQCEIHAYVEGPNRAWLADLIEQGLASGVLRRGMGWDAKPDHPHGKGPGVVPLLRSRDDEPVVLSDSSCDGFPYAASKCMPMPPEEWKPEGWTDERWANLAEEDRDDYRDERRSEDFDDLPTEEQWDRAMAWLRERSETMLLEFKPDDWDTYRFGHSLTLMDLEEGDWQARVERALGLEPAL